MNRYETCPVCDGSFKIWRTKVVMEEKYNIDRCKTCGYAFVNPRPSLDFLMNFYSSFGHSHDGGANLIEDIEAVIARECRYPNSSLDARRMISVINSLLRNKNTESKKFLDVGCGYGFFSKEAKDTGFDVLALELARNEGKIAQEMAGVEPIACSFEEFEQGDKSFGIVLMSQILEHALDVNLWMSKAHDLLADDGILAIALPNFGSIFRLVMQEKEPYICPPAHLNFFNPNNLGELLQKHGFVVEKTQWVSRLPSSSFEKRLPGFGQPFLPLVNAMSTATLGAVDFLHLGMTINVYARKIDA